MLQEIFSTHCVIIHTYYVLIHCIKEESFFSYYRRYLGWVFSPWLTFSNVWYNATNDKNNSKANSRDNPKEYPIISPTMYCFGDSTPFLFSVGLILANGRRNHKRQDQNGSYLHFVRRPFSDFRRFFIVFFFLLSSSVSDWISNDCNF